MKYFGNGIHHIFGKEIAATCTRGKHIFGFRNQVFPIIWSRVGRIHDHDFFVGCFTVGDHVQGGTLVIDYIGIGIGVVQNSDQFRILLREVHHKQFVARCGHRSGNEQILLVFGNGTAYVTVLLFWCATKNDFVLGLGRSQFVIIQFMLVGFCGKLASFGLIVAGIKETVVSFPRNTTELDVH